MRFLRLAAAMLPFLATTALALDPGQRVDNFRLMDQHGKSHELYYLSDMKAVVLMTHQNDCKHVDAAIPQLAQLQQQYAQRGVTVLMLNSTAADPRDTVLATTSRLNASIPVLLDPLQLIGESLDTVRAGETLVINPKGWTLTYRGPVDHAAEAVDATLSGATIKKAERRTKGCKIKLPENDRLRAHKKISYEHTIAPMLIDSCVNCHRAGGIGPWAMTNYDMVRGFAPMIREVLRTQRMPPWHADPHYGVFSNDRSLTVEETKTLVHWIEAGAPRDKKAADPLTAYAKTWPAWTMGEPDLVVEIPAFNVPATGTIPYQRPVVKNPLGRDVWLRAIEFAPTDRSVVHHILAGTTGASGDALSRLEATTSLGVYVPGDVPQPVPQDTGVFVSKDADFVFQMHYTASGKAVSEVTKVGLYFSKEVPTYPLRNTVLLDPRLKIPANTKDHQASVSRTFNRDTLIYTLMAHSHVRGKSARFEATYPDGKTEVLLSVPHYDFNWQTSYSLTTPKLLPKGTKLVYYSSYDNSTQNKANPDPTIDVRWGEQTWEEMIYGDVRFRYVDEVNAKTKLSAAE
jgi:thiol-disulfide isomerase/thioredoxin